MTELVWPAGDPSALLKKTSREDEDTEMLTLQKLLVFQTARGAFLGMQSTNQQRLFTTRNAPWEHPVNGSLPPHVQLKSL